MAVVSVLLGYGTEAYYCHGNFGPGNFGPPDQNFRWKIWSASVKIGPG